MSGIHKLTIFTCADTVTAADFIDIDFSAAGFLNPPVVVATVDDNINTFISDLTTSTARINFSTTFTGRVTYIIRPASPT